MNKEYSIPFWENENETGSGINIHTWAETSDRALEFATRQVAWLREKGLAIELYPGEPQVIDPSKWEYGH